MKRVLITGKDSYIGESFRKYVAEHYPSDIEVDSISVRGDEWRSYDFSRYDTVLHVAALVHKNEKDIALAEYLKVNRDLSIAVAEKAKSSGVNQFIFLSTIAVYGIVSGLKIDINTELAPVTKYGISKLDAEHGLKELAGGRFNVAIVRPPMIYGRNCPGNYSRLSNLASKLSVYPKVINKRSMIYIENLSEFLYQICVQKLGGIFLPQNQDYVETSELIKLIRQSHGKSTLFIPGFSRLLLSLTKRNSAINKIYGSLMIDRSLNSVEFIYDRIPFKQTVKSTEDK